MSNFLDLEENDKDSAAAQLRELVSRVPVAAPQTRLAPDLSDRLAAEHGFSSRERDIRVKTVGGRRQARGIPAEETRQLSIRMPLSLYNDFLAFADAKKLTYNEAIRSLLDGG